MRSIKNLLAIGLLGLLGCKPDVEELLVENLESTKTPEICVLEKVYPGITDRDMNLLTKVVYLEGDHTIEGDAAIANVIVNRYEFDKNKNTNKFGRNFEDIVMKPYAFESVKKYSECFNSESNDLTCGNMDENTLNLAYDSVFRALLHQTPDNTNGSTYFKTKQKNGKVWHGAEAFWMDEKPLFTKHKIDIGNHRFYGLTGEKI